MNDFSNIAEYSVTKKRSKLFYALKILLPIVSLFVSFVISNLLTQIYSLAVGLVSLTALAASSITYCILHFRRVDYDYRMIGSELFFSAVYNRRKRKELGSIDVSKLERFAPYEGKYLDEAEKNNYVKIHDFSSSPSDIYVYYGVEANEDSGEKTLYIFNASEKMLKLIKTYNRRAITVYPNE